MNALEKKNPAIEAGLPGRFGDANSGDSIVSPSPADVQEGLIHVALALGRLDVLTDALAADVAALAREVAAC